jgi:type IV secretory pathway TraG/TraD family ATPase VirD4
MHNNTNNNTKKVFTYCLCTFIFALFCYISNYLSGFVGALRYNFKYKLSFFDLSKQPIFQFNEFVKVWWVDALPPAYIHIITLDNFINIAIACFTVLFLSLILWLVWQSFNASNNQNNTKTHGSARFASKREIALAGLLPKQLQQKPSMLLGKFNNSFLYFDQAKFVALAAPTRSGKGVGIVIPNLLHWTSSLVCLDIKGENFDKTSGFRAQFSKVYKFDPFSEYTHCYNPLSYISRDASKTISDIQTIARILWPYNDKEPIWNDSSCNLFQGLVLCLILYFNIYSKLSTAPNHESINTYLNFN